MKNFLSFFLLLIALSSLSSFTNVQALESNVFYENKYGVQLNEEEYDFK